MKARMLLSVTLLLSVLLVACELVPTLPVTVREGFESGGGGWEKGADVPDDPNQPGQKVAWSIRRSQEQASEGASSARFFLDGRQDDGTIWLVREFYVPAEQDVTVSLSFDVWSQDESFNTIAYVVACAGDRWPVWESDFNLEQSATQVAGWRRYDYRFDARSDASRNGGCMAWRRGDDIQNVGFNDVQHCGQIVERWHAKHLGLGQILIAGRSKLNVRHTVPCLVVELRKISRAKASDLHTSRAAIAAAASAVLAVPPRSRVTPFRSEIADSTASRRRIPSDASSSIP